MKKLLVFLFITSCFYIFNSCSEPSRGDVINVTRLYFNNSTNYLIKFIPYKNGLAITDSIKVFLPNTITQLEGLKFNSQSGASSTFDFKYRRNTDSIMVIFNNIKKEKHKFSVTNTLVSPYLPSKERSIYTNDGGAYDVKIIEQRKNFIEVEFTYTFSEQDYLDAELIN